MLQDGNKPLLFPSYRTLDPQFYGLEAVSRYEEAAASAGGGGGEADGEEEAEAAVPPKRPPPHIFAVGAAAYRALVTKNGQNQASLPIFFLKKKINNFFLANAKIQKNPNHFAEDGQKLFAKKRTKQP